MKGLRFAKFRLSTSMTLIILFALLAAVLQFATYWAFRDLLGSTARGHEIDKVKSLSNSIQGLIRSQTERVAQVAQLLAASGELPRHLQARDTGREAAIAAAVEEARRISQLDILEVVDDHGVVVYSAQDPTRHGERATMWGVSEALGGRGMLTSSVDPRGVAICAVAPLEAQGRVLGALIAGVGMNEKFITALSAQAGADLALLARTGGHVASSRDMLAHIDPDAVVEAFHQKTPVYRRDPAAHYTNVYLPALIVDEAFVLLARIDSSQAHRLLDHGLRRSAASGAIILGAGVLLGIVTLRYVLRPLRRLRVIAEQTAAELTGEDVAPDSRNEVAALVHVLERLTRRLVEHNKELGEANAKLKELDRMKSELVSSVSHELRTPLTSVLGFAKLIHHDFSRIIAPGGETAEREKLVQRVGRNLEIITAEAGRLASIINDFLDLAKIESGAVTWKETRVNVGELVRTVAASALGVFAQNPGLEFILSVPAEPPPVQADPDRIQQVLLNLISNAVKFTPQGTVELAVAEEGRRVRFSVRDTGVGISPQELGMIFDPFYQAAPGGVLEGKPRGTGLGLSICRGILAHYGSRIRVESEPGRGSTFSFDLPLAPPADAPSPQNPL